MKTLAALEELKISNTGTSQILFASYMVEMSETDLSGALTKQLQAVEAELAQNTLKVAQEDEKFQQWAVRFTIRSI